MLRERKTHPFPSEMQIFRQWVQRAGDLGDMIGDNDQIPCNDQNGTNSNAGAVTASVLLSTCMCRARAQSPLHIRSSRFGAGTELPLCCDLMGPLCLFRWVEAGLRGRQPRLQIQSVGASTGRTVRLPSAPNAPIRFSHIHTHTHVPPV